MSKLTSRKFWISVAAFLASVAGAVTGFATDNEIMTGIGVVCAVLSAGIYTACEAYVDGQDTMSSTLAVQASTTSKEVVASLLTDDKDASEVED